MDRLAKSIVLMLIGSLTLGVLVVLLNPEYRGTALAFWHGSTTNTPIWQTNQDYYPEIKPEL